MTDEELVTAIKNAVDALNALLRQAIEQHQIEYDAVITFQPPLNAKMVFVHRFRKVLSWF